MSMVYRWLLIATCYLLFAICCWLFVVNCQLSIVSCQLSIVSCMVVGITDNVPDVDLLDAERSEAHVSIVAMSSRRIREEGSFRDATVLPLTGSCAASRKGPSSRTPRGANIHATVPLTTDS
jgi:hypothetical protein